MAGRQCGDNFTLFLNLLLEQFTPVGLALALMGLWSWGQRDRSLLVGAALVSIIGVSFAVQYDISEDGDAYFLTTFLWLGLAMAAGWGELWRRGAREHELRRTVSGGSGAGPAGAQSGPALGSL